MANKPSTATEPNLDFDELFAGEQQPASAAAPAEEENLEELEAFLDEFEKNLDEAPRAPAAKSASDQPSPAPVAAATAVAPASVAFSEPTHAEELVQGLLKENELDLDVEAAPSVATAKPPRDELPDFEPAPLAPPAFIHAAPASKPVPAAAAGFSRIGFILALVLGGTALLIAIGAGWLAWNATAALQNLETQQVVAGPGAADGARIAKLQGDVAALRKQVDELAKAVEGPIAHLADSYQRDMEQLQGRVAQLETAPAPVSSPATEAPKTAGSAKPDVAKVEAAKPEAVKPDAGKVAKPEAAKPEAAKPEATKPEAPKVASAAPSKPSPAAKPTGAWVVHLASADERKRAEGDLARARAAGIKAEVTSAQMGGKTWYRVTVQGFATADEARGYVANAAKKAGFGAAWIAKR